MYEPSVVLLFLSVFLIQGRSVVRVCESLSKLHEYISSSELKLPSSTLSLEEDLKVFPAFRVSTKSSVLVKIGPTSVQITTPERHRVLGYSSILNDVYYASEIKGVCSFTLLLSKETSNPKWNNLQVFLP